ncbi:MAG TPA: hypothetical protein VHO67_12595, partial [Polyangia bacterium]|nr:hypothetical protein [Polyangia bacterium]
MASSCLTLSGNLDAAAAGLDPHSCSSATISGSLTVTGTFSAKADSSYTDGTTTTGTATIQLGAGCLMLSGTTTTCQGLVGPLAALGFASVTCSNASSGGGCTCQAMIQQTGGLGFPTSDASTSGNYATSGNTLTIDGTQNYDYCASATQLTVSPKTIAMKTTGTIVLHSGSAAGTGGTIGSGGSGTGTGGSGTGTGGAGGRGTGG